MLPTVATDYQSVKREQTAATRNPTEPSRQAQLRMGRQTNSRSHRHGKEAYADYWLTPKRGRVQGWGHCSNPNAFPTNSGGK